MTNKKKVIVVLPAYNAEKTLRQTYNEIPFDVVDEVLLVDDASSDATIQVAKELGIQYFVHAVNSGYGANQKTCYKEALKRNADIVIMLHPDYQYTPKLIRSMVSLIDTDLFDVVLGSRILGVGALNGGMPLYKYISNRFLTHVENILLNYKLAEYHTGYRAFSRKTLELVPWDKNSDDFVFDNQMLAQIIFCGLSIGEITCPTKYFPEASSINFIRSLKYGLGVLWTAIQFRLHKMGVKKFPIFEVK